MLFVAALIAANKVGSPQYIGWFAVPVVWGLAAGRSSARRFLPIAVVALVTAALTQAIYPAYYDQVLTVRPGILVVLTLRNVLEVVLLVWSIVGVVRLGTRAVAPSAVRAPAVGSAPVEVEPGRMDA